jgi:hypothetical protein
MPVRVASLSKDRSIGLWDPGLKSPIKLPYVSYVDGGLKMCRFPAEGVLKIVSNVNYFRSYL